jgi:hypothetical protein
MRFEAKVDGMQKRPCAAASGFLRAELFAEVGQLQELHGNQQRSLCIAPYCCSTAIEAKRAKRSIQTGGGISLSRDR